MPTSGDRDAAADHAVSRYATSVEFSQFQQSLVDIHDVRCYPLAANVKGSRVACTTSYYD